MSGALKGLAALAAAIGAEGLEAAALREAASTEYGQLMRFVSDAVNALSRDQYVQIVALYADRVVVTREARFYAIPYTVAADNTVALGTEAEVLQAFSPVSMVEASRDSFVEAVASAIEADAGTLWDVVVIRSGVSKNGWFYPDAVLREAAPLFDGTTVFAKSDEQHLAGKGKDVRQIAGWLADAKFVEGAKADTGRIVARLHVSAAEQRMRALMVDAWARGKKDLVGLSIDADGTAAPAAMREGVKCRTAKSITRVKSVDMIVEPGAGGEFVRLIEAASTQEKNVPQENNQALAADPKIVQAAVDAAVAAALPIALREAVGIAQASIQARTAAIVRVTGSKLPAATQSRVIAALDAQVSYTEAAVDAALKTERDYLANFVEAGHVSLPHFGDGARAEDRSVKMAAMLDDFFAGKKGSHSFRECYRELTGDTNVTGLIANCDRVRLREAAGGDVSFREALDTTVLSNVLGAALARKMIQDYAGLVEWDTWRKIVSVNPVVDFRTQEITRMGGYANLPGVNQSQPYLQLNSPTDEKATYVATKRGGLESITLEAIKNDDVRVINAVPTRMALAAKRTLYEFVFDFIRTNPVLYDSVAFFHATHANLGTTALDANQWQVARVAMLKQAEANSLKRLGIWPKFLCVPVDLQETAYNLFQRTTNNDPTFVNQQQVEVIPVIYWNDNNDWSAVASPMACPGIEIGFLDGQEDPDLFVQDSPTVGSLFSDDEITYKIRHIYGGQVHNFRCAFKGVVP